MVAVFREVWRVLREDGTCWVNMGDSYARDDAKGGSGPGKNRDNGDAYGKSKRLGAAQLRHVKSLERQLRWADGLKPKDLVGIPWRLAFALQADRWYLRSDIICSKPNPMPESVTDRPTKSHEYLFLLSKSERYYFDAEAVRSPALYAGDVKKMGAKSLSKGQANGMGGSASGNGNASTMTVAAGRNIRSVWSIPTESYPGSHFATFPRKLVEPCVKAGTSERGCCPVCGAAWVREVDNQPKVLRRSSRADAMDKFGRTQASGTMISPAISKTTDWRPTCTHDAEPVPCVVLDPFSGTSTTGVVALALKRRYVGLDLSRDYLGQAVHRLTRPHAPIQRPGKPEHHPLFGDSA
jgi:DNA modification methylase